MALGHLKVSKEIGNLTTEQSPEAKACRRFYAICKAKINTDFKWPFATTQVLLALIEDNPLPIDENGDTEWGFAYQYPADAMNIVRIISGIRNESRQDRVPYRILAGPNGTKMIVTDMDQAACEYTQEVTAEDSFGAGYALTLSLLLAAYIAPLVTGGDPFKLGQRAMDLYKMEKTQTIDNALNEEQVEENPESEMIRARGYIVDPWTRGVSR